MPDIIKMLQSMPNFHSLTSVTLEEIELSERELNLKFSDEYRAYVGAFGFASANGHELTGVCKFPRLNVVDVTRSERLLNPDIPGDWYVVEQAHIDGIVVWQSGNEEVYQTAPNTLPEKICGSLSEYLDMS